MLYQKTRRVEPFLSHLFWVVLIIACVGTTLVWSWFAGKDHNWDSLNYHFYAPYLWSEDRLTQDFLAASIQSYLNPLSYLPFYWMVRAEWPSLLIGSFLAAFHSLNLILVAVLSHRLLPETLPLRRFWIVASVLVSGISPIFASEIGSTFNEITTSILVLGAYLCCIGGIQHFVIGKNGGFRPEYLRTWFVSGLLMGLAAGFKLTNAVFAVGLIPLILTARTPLVGIKRLVTYSGGGTLGFLIAHGLWSWRLYVEFENPFFPFFNGLFKSPAFPEFNFRHERFIPESITEAILFPLTVLKPIYGTYIEISAPDARYLVTLAIVALLFSVLLLRAFFRKAVTRQSNEVAPVIPWLAFAWLLTYALWLLLFGNGRYFLPGALLAGPLIVAILASLFNGHRFVAYAICFLIVAQFVQVRDAGQWRWGAVHTWDDNWFNIQVPESLEKNAFLYLTPRVQTAMYVAPFLNPGSAFSNIGGQVPIAADGPGSDRVRAMIARYGRNVRSFYQIGRLPHGTTPDPASFRAFDGVYDRFGLETDPTSCEVIQSERPSATITANEDGPGVAAAILSCSLVERRGEALTGTREQRRIDAVFDEIERTCPRRFSPQNSLTTRYQFAWGRKYANSDIDLLYNPDEGTIFFRAHGLGEPVFLGTLDQWEQGRQPAVDCSLKRGVFKINAEHTLKY